MLIDPLLGAVIVGLLMAAWGDIRWWRYEAGVWEQQAEKGCRLAQEILDARQSDLSEALSLVDQAIGLANCGNSGRNAE